MMPIVGRLSRVLPNWPEDAGFFPISLMLDTVIEPPPPRAWKGFANSSGNPNIPTVAEAMEQALTTTERDQLTAHLRPLVEQGLGEWRMASAYLTATRSTGTHSLGPHLR